MEVRAIFKASSNTITQSVFGGFAIAGIIPADIPGERRAQPQAKDRRA